MAGPSGTTPIRQLPYPTPDDTVDVPRDMKALAEKLDPYVPIPTGAIMMWWTANAPAGWHIMAGPVATCTVAANPGLAAIFGDDGTGKVNLPDMRDKFAAGAGPTNGAVAAQGGANSVKLTGPQSGIAKHKHTTTENDHSHSAGSLGGAWAIAATGGGGKAMTPAPNNAATLTFQDQSGMLGGSTGVKKTGLTVNDINDTTAAQTHENRPAFRAINFIVKGG